MAERGKPLPINERLAIRQTVSGGTSQREAARQHGVARETVRKYAPKGSR
jgi:transposase